MKEIMLHEKEIILFVRYLIDGIAVSQCFFPGHFSNQNNINSIDDLKNRLREDYCLEFNKDIEYIKTVDSFDIKNFN